MASRQAFSFQLRPLIQRCDTFTDNDNNMESISIIVAPTFFVPLERGGWNVVWKCSRGRVCQNGCCFFSQKTFERKRLH